MRAIIIVAFLFIAGFSFSQENRMVNLSFAMGENNMITLETLDGAASHNGDGYYSLSLGYCKPIRNWLHFSIGIIAGYHKLITLPNLGPLVDVLPINEHLILTSIPVGMQVNFFRYFFFTASALIDIDFSKSKHLDNQTGLGAQASFGFHYPLKQGYGIYLSPELSFHSLIPFSSANYHKRLFETGIKVGVTRSL